MLGQVPKDAFPNHAAMMTNVVLNHQNKYITM